MSVNSRLTAGLTVDKDILATSRNGDRKIMQSIISTRRPSQEQGSETSSASSAEHLLK